MKHVTITPPVKHHVHPTPLHIRACCFEEMHAEAKKWQEEHGVLVPIAHLVEAMNRGVTRACREHNEECQ